MEVEPPPTLADRLRALVEAAWEVTRDLRCRQTQPCWVALSPVPGTATAG